MQKIQRIQANGRLSEVVFIKILRIFAGQVVKNTQVDAYFSGVKKCWR